MWIDVKCSAVVVCGPHYITHFISHQHLLQHTIPLCNTTFQIAPYWSHYIAPYWSHYGSHGHVSHCTPFHITFHIPCTPRHISDHTISGHIMHRTTGISHTTFHRPLHITSCIIASFHIWPWSHPIPHPTTDQYTTHSTSHHLSHLAQHHLHYHILRRVTAHTLPRSTSHNIPHSMPHTHTLPCSTLHNIPYSMPQRTHHLVPHRTTFHIPCHSTHYFIPHRTTFHIPCHSTHTSPYYTTAFRHNPIPVWETRTRLVYVIRFVVFFHSNKPFIKPNTKMVKKSNQINLYYSSIYKA